MKLTILGCHSATPKIDAHTSSQLLDVNGNLFLIDCGENTQIQLRKFGIKFSRIKNIFISHLHGDHFYGLVGLISTFRLLGRESELNIYGPKGIKEIITLQLNYAKSWTNYNLIFHELTSSKSEVVFENNKLVISTIPLNHRVYTNGFLFKEKIGLRKINLNAPNLAFVDRSFYQNLKLGKDYVDDDGNVISNSELTSNPRPAKSYAYCSDTQYDESIIPIIHGVDLLYHESTFLEEHTEIAFRTKHSTAKQAAKIARLSNSKKLILGHLSTRYHDFSKFIDETKKDFQNVELAYDGKIIEF